MSILSDGPHARKTNGEKELVLVRTERNGIGVYFAVSLLEMGYKSQLYQNYYQWTFKGQAEMISTS